MDKSKAKLSKDLCPKCKKNFLYKERALNSLSRKDNKTYICNDCGRNEAMQDVLKNFSISKRG